MSDDPDDRTASLMTPGKLAQLKERPRAAASPAAWLDQLAADAGSGHVRRLADLRRQLQAQLAEGGADAVAAAAAALGAALQQLDYAQVQPRGWLARATGKGREAASGFVAQVDRIQRAGEDLADDARGMQKQLQQQGPAAERSVLEMEVELRALEKIMDQGARWLQDMRNQLKTRQAEASDAAAQQRIQEDTDRCDLLVARLKQLRAASSAAQPALERCRALAPRRAALLQAAQQLQEGPWKAWQKQIAPVADQAAAGAVAQQGVDSARSVQQALAAAAAQLAQECGGWRQQAEAAAGELDALQGPLAAAA